MLPGNGEILEWTKLPVQYFAYEDYHDNVEF
jgi:hypothetical protein